MDLSPKDQLILFLFEAYDTAHRVKVRGSWWARSSEQAEFWLQSQGYRGIRLHPKPTTPDQITVNQAALAFFYRQIAVMFHSGVPLHDALRFAATTDDRNLSGIGLLLAELLAAGHSLSEALKTFPSVFGPVTVGLIAAAERTGQLALVLDRIADAEIRRYELKRSLLSALTYPVLLLVSTIILSLVLVLYILPMNQELLQSLHIGQSLFHRAIGTVVQAVNSPFFPVILLAAAGAVAAKLRTVESRKVFGQQVIAIASFIPAVRHLVSQTRSYRFLEILALILESGGTFSQALRSMGAAAVNPWESDQISTLHDEIMNGSDLALALKQVDLFPPLVISLLEVGQEAGQLAEMSRHAARICEEDVRLAIETASTVIEPLMMAAVGLMTGVAIVSTALPMLSVLSSL